ncbi:MAG: hypothetical protein Q7Q73_12645 [Verrucomicrobiota bacterium JB024]|nr:hypothetical protein [Verrucomicrobiota bacterium JB024]
MKIHTLASLFILGLYANASADTVLFADDFSSGELRASHWPMQRATEGAIAVMDSPEGGEVLVFSPPEQGKSAVVCTTTFKANPERIKISWEENISGTAQAGIFVALLDGSRYPLMLSQTRFGDYRRKTPEGGALAKVADLQPGWRSCALIIDRTKGAVEFFYDDTENASALFEIIGTIDSFDDVRLVFGVDSSASQQVRLRDVKVEALDS